MQRDQYQSAASQGAPQEHQPTLPEPDDEEWDRKRIEHAAYGESGNQKPGDGGACLPARDSSSATYGKRPWMKMASKKTDPKHTLARGSAKMLRKIASTTARSNDACCCGTTARSAKKAAIATPKENRLSAPKTPRQPNRSPITPEIEAPTRFPVSATASSRPIATWR